MSTVAVSAGSQLIASAGGDSLIKLWHLDGTLAQTLVYGDFVFDLQFSPDAQEIAASGEDGIKVWNLGDYSLAYSLAQTASIYQVSDSPDGGSATIALSTMLLDVSSCGWL